MDIPVHSIAALQRGYAERRWSVKAVVEAVLARIAAAEAIDPAIWIARVDRERLLAEAAALDARGPAGLPLFGVPFAVKDNIDVAGLPTTAACPEFAYAPERSATAVARLTAAGALVIGKTNLDQFATGLVGVRSPHGAPRSPFDHALRFGRLELRLGGRGVARPGQLLARHRHRRLGPRSRRLLQSHRPQAEPRADQRRRRRARLPVARLRLDLRRHRRRRCGGAGGRGRVRRRRPLQPRAADAADRAAVGAARPASASACRASRTFSSSATPRPKRCSSARSSA